MSIADRIRSGNATEQDSEISSWLVNAVIQRGAYLLWEEAGKPEGMSDHFWYMAEQSFMLFLSRHQ